MSLASSSSVDTDRPLRIDQNKPDRPRTQMERWYGRSSSRSQRGVSSRRSRLVLSCLTKRARSAELRSNPYGSRDQITEIRVSLAPQVAGRGLRIGRTRAPAAGGSPFAPLALGRQCPGQLDLHMYRRCNISERRTQRHERCSMRRRGDSEQMWVWH